MRIDDCGFEIADLKSAICNPQSAIRNRQSAIRNWCLAFDPLSSRAAAFDKVTGKLRWETTLKGQSDVIATGANSGASLSGSRLLVYGRHAAILDADTGEVAWAFQRSRVPTFPVRLPEPEEDLPKKAAAALPAPTPYLSHPSYAYRTTFRFPPPAGRLPDQGLSGRCSCAPHHRELPGPGGAKLLSP